MQGQEEATVLPSVPPEAEAQKQYHDYYRHTFQQVVSWFTFFVTINYASMGWLATNGGLEIHRFLTAVVSLVFITQNILGIVACLRLRRWFQTFGDGFRFSEANRPQLNVITPRELYINIVWLMMYALIPILLAWVVFLVAYGCRISFR